MSAYLHCLPLLKLVARPFVKGAQRLSSKPSYSSHRKAWLNASMPLNGLQLFGTTIHHICPLARWPPLWRINPPPHSHFGHVQHMRLDRVTHYNIPIPTGVWSSFPRCWSWQGRDRPSADSDSSAVQLLCAFSTTGIVCWVWCHWELYPFVGWRIRRSGTAKCKKGFRRVGPEQSKRY